MSKRSEILAVATAANPRWAAVLARDPASDGEFFYAVKTTGVYCRPSCAARSARPENVEFHLTAADAERAGFRPCKRCRPDQPPLAERQASLVAELCRLIGNAEQVPSLRDLAQHAAMSAYHLHRVFKAVTGLTPTDYRAGGAKTEIRLAIGECSLGAILVAASEHGVCAILMGDDPDKLARDLRDRFPRAELVGSDAAFEQIVANVVGFVEAPGLGLDLPLDVRGTAFQQRVWQALREIPAGTTVSYTEIARRIGAPQSVRAVAHACAANTLAVAIPCHRVVRNDGAVSGYRWGVERKRALLKREARTGMREPLT
jgi:AraC family transcriptional regulator, regulatory protein of adaptative response / methylated-DNA-[protein]-cysteine methyltransferase